MRRSIAALALAASSAALPRPATGQAVVPGAAQPAAASQTITVNVGPFRNTHGSLECSLFGSERGFPEHAETAVAQRRAPIRPDRTATCVFAGVAPGTYAVGVMHDENDNGKFDTGFLGIPKEGYGFSNNHTHALSAPTWEESRFEVAPGRDVELHVSPRY